MKKFEYKIIHFFLKETDSWWHSGSIEREFNYLGVKGWELVKVDDKVAFFKREITGERLAKLEAEQEAREAARKAEEEAKYGEMQAKITELERAYQYIENIPQLKGSSKPFTYVGQLKREEITFDEFKARIDELIE